MYTHTHTQFFSLYPLGLPDKTFAPTNSCYCRYVVANDHYRIRHACMEKHRSSHNTGPCMLMLRLVSSGRRVRTYNLLSPSIDYGWIP